LIFSQYLKTAYWPVVEKYLRSSSGAGGFQGECRVRKVDYYLPFTEQKGWLMNAHAAGKSSADDLPAALLLR
jgi:hypothetical protein